MKCPKCNHSMFQLVHPEAEIFGGSVIDHPHKGIFIRLKYLCNGCNSIFSYSLDITNDQLEEIK
jgi:hypothetical protein